MYILDLPPIQSKDCASTMEKSQVVPKKHPKKDPGKWLLLFTASNPNFRLCSLRYFPTNKWAWQHPSKSRHFKENKIQEFTGKQRERYLDGKILALLTMLHLDQFKRWPLNLHFTSEEVWLKFSSKKVLDIPKHIRITRGALHTLPFDQDISVDGIKALTRIHSRQR